MKLQGTLMLMILSTLLLISGHAWAKRNRGHAHRRGESDKRQTRGSSKLVSVLNILNPFLRTALVRLVMIYCVI